MKKAIANVLYTLVTMIAFIYCFGYCFGAGFGVILSVMICYEILGDPITWLYVPVFIMIWLPITAVGFGLMALSFYLEEIRE